MVGAAFSLLLFVAPLTECNVGPPTDPPPTTQPPRNCDKAPVPDASLIPNGDFNDGWVDFDDPGAPATTARPGEAPVPWGVSATPDFSTADQISFDSPGTPRASLPGFAPSPAGGSFMGFRSLPSSEEGIFNDLRILDPAEEITIFFYYTEYTAPDAPAGPDRPVNIEFRFDIDPNGSPNGGPETTGSLVGDVPNLAETGGVAGTWEERRITFTPADLGVTAAGDYPFYLGAKLSAVGTWAFVDGLVVNTTEGLCPKPPTSPPVPKPPVGGACTATVSQSLMANGDFNLGYLSPVLPGWPGVFAQRASAPWPWRTNGTADFSTDLFVSFDDLGNPRVLYPGFATSPTGGSFMGLRTARPGRNEGVVGYLPIADPTDEITMVFDYTEYPRGVHFQVPPTDPDVATQIRFGVAVPRSTFPGRSDTSGVVVADVANLSSSGGVSGTWEERRITFTPADLGFTQPGPYLLYIGAKESARSTWAFVDGLVVNTTESFC
jgi:hypothetical protein